MTTSWLASLKQRKVFRMTAIYAVTGYAVFQIANNLLPALDLPRWTVSLLAALFLIGFPVVIVLSYAFDYTDGRLTRTRTLPRLAALGWADWALLAAALAVFVFAGVQLGRGLRAAARPAPETAAATPAPPAVPERSVAVLPFVSFGEERDAGHFADGLTEELIHGLAQLPDLHVAGRTSSFYYKGRNEDLREIGRRLGVAHVIEGSVRRSGETLRITAQLIKVSDGFHLWSQTFDQVLDDPLALQSQIAAAVSSALRLRFTAAEKAVAPASRDARAWQLELTARSRLRQQELEELQAARGMFAELMRLEPRNPRAHAGYAEATLYLLQGHLALDFEPARTASQRAVDEALRLDPRSAEGWRLRGLLNRVLAIRTGEQGYRVEELRALERAIELDPHDSEALTSLAQLRTEDRQPAAAVALLQRALAIDPLSRRTQQILGATLASQGRIGEATRQYRALLQLHPDFTPARVALGTLLVEQGRLDEAVPVLDDAAAIRADPLTGFLLAICYANLGLDAQMSALLQGMREPPLAAALARTVLLARQGRFAELQEHVAREYRASRDPLWRSSQLLAAVMLDDRARQRRLLAEPGQGLLQDPPGVEQNTPIDALVVATALRRSGNAAQADRIARALLRRAEAAPGDFDRPSARWTRLLAAASLGDVPRALDELEGAEKAGFRTLIDSDYLLRLEDYPFMAAVAGEPRFRAAVERIEADNRRMRDQLLATRGGQREDSR